MNNTVPVLKDKELNKLLAHSLGYTPIESIEEYRYFEHLFAEEDIEFEFAIWQTEGVEITPYEETVYELIPVEELSDLWFMEPKDFLHQQIDANEETIDSKGVTFRIHGEGKIFAPWESLAIKINRW